MSPRACEAVVRGSQSGQMTRYGGSGSGREHWNSNPPVGLVGAGWAGADLLRTFCGLLSRRQSMSAGAHVEPSVGHPRVDWQGHIPTRDSPEDEAAIVEWTSGGCAKGASATEARPVGGAAERRLTQTASLAASLIRKCRLHRRHYGLAAIFEHQVRSYR